MAKKRKPDNETSVQQQERLTKESIANYATRSEKTSWNRKRLNMEKVINTEIRPVEERILDLHLELRPLYDTIASMRSEMVEFCVHPFDLLVHVGDDIHCKFCQKTMAPRPADE